jgi:hypothetical protein
VTLARSLAIAAVLGVCAGPAFAAAAGPGTGTNTWQCAPYQAIAAAPFPSNGPYTAAADGVITGVSGNDAQAMLNGGCRLLGAGGGAFELLGRLTGANMNATTDQPFVWFAAPSTVYRVTKITCTNASTSLTTAAGGVYTAASKGGSAIVAAAQAYSSLTGATLALDLTIAATPGVTFFSSNTAPPILSLTTAQGAAATADCYVYGQLGQ